MSNMNFSQRNSSSSSSEEEDNGKEKHYDSKCKYERIIGVVDRMECVFLVRICKCKMYPDKSYVIERKCFSEQDGVEVHFRESCEWQMKQTSYGTTVYKLKRDCKCRQPQTASGVSSMNYVPSAY
ncbi:uncharacterized protein LOC128219890 [Mya arenaria]|uniref:uncharacterized protein LOC128219890 n=1 Tax=Mya arenaria TaxID=6604 RepID=UPI0022E11FA0|nr:uncharacterized protein LOC128219890 [Mya arenaria]